MYLSLNSSVDTASTRSTEVGNMRITKSAVDKLEAPSKDSSSTNNQKRFYDETLKGFGIRITSGGSKAFFIEKRMGNKLRRMTIGQYPALTVEQARSEAQKLLGKIATGIDPLSEKQESRVKGVTLEQVFEDYLVARKTLKPTTIKDYRCILDKSFADWKTKPLDNITKDMVAKKHATLGVRSEARANLAMRLLRAIFTFAAGEYENAKGQSIFLDNPVKRLSHMRSWFRVPRRTTVIKPHQLSLWYKALQDVLVLYGHNHFQTTCDYLLLILFTGLRREEAAKLRWSQIDFNSQSLTIADTKNNTPHTLPLSDFLFNLLQKRKTGSKPDGVFVFTGSGKHGYIVEPRKAMARITELSGVEFTLHDLRRTFITIAESLDIPAYSLKNLLNHKMAQDVTAGYIIISSERLRGPMQKITDKIISLCTILQSTHHILDLSQTDPHLL